MTAIIFSKQFDTSIAFIVETCNIRSYINEQMCHQMSLKVSLEFPNQIIFVHIWMDSGDVSMLSWQV